jgi:hypothetical protein
MTDIGTLIAFLRPSSKALSRLNKDKESIFISQHSELCKVYGQNRSSAWAEVELLMV